MLDHAEFDRKWQEHSRNDPDNAHGMEHMVYPDGNGSYIKRTPVVGMGEEFVIGPNGMWLDYFNRLELHRQFFPESEYQLLVKSISANRRSDDCIAQSQSIGDY